MDFPMTVLGDIRHLPEEERKLMEDECRSIEEGRKIAEERRRLGSNPPDWLVLFRQAEKEYSDLLASEEPVEFPNKSFCSEGRKHKLTPINWEWTCRECGLIVDRVYNPCYDYDRWDSVIMRRRKVSIDDKFESFCTKKKITYSDLSVGGRRIVIDDIYKVRNAEKPEGKRLPNLDILTYQICKRHNIRMDEGLLSIPASRVPHDRCKEIFRTLGWEYIECGQQSKAPAKETVMKDLSMSDIDFRYEGFCKRMKITYFMLSVKDRSRIVEDIKKLHDAKEPKMRTLPNLNILTYQICKRLNITVNEKLLNIPVSKTPHNRCKKVFQTLGWEYVE